MTDVEMLDPASYRRIPWKNGGGMLVNIAGESSGSWQGGGVDWHYGRTAIVAPGPFSDLTGYERLQVVIRGQGLVLVTPSGEIDLRRAFVPVRYDGGMPIVTRLENASVEVANLIADRARFAIELRVGAAGDVLACRPGEHVVHAAAEAAIIDVSGSRFALADDHAVRLRPATPIGIAITSGRVLVASVHPKPA